jgi:hypothetical protein
MKRILIVAILAIAIGSCDTPQTTTGTASDTTMTARPDTAAMTTPDTTRQQ